MTPAMTRSVIVVSTSEILTRSDCRSCAVDNLVPFNIDLTVHEGVRLAAVLEALGPRWNPTEIYAGEAEARRRLYAHLDPDQQATLDALIADGALPNITRR
jgi:hypothetical protein